MSTDEKPADASGEEIVPMPVPRKYVTAVICALADAIRADEERHRRTARGEGTQGVPWPDDSGARNRVEIDWDEAKLRRLRNRLSNAAATKLLDLAADRPGQRVYISDVMEQLGCSHGRVGAGLGVLTKTINKMLNLKGQSYNWPAEFNWDPDRQLAFYQMDPEVAQAWAASRRPNASS